MAIGEVSKTQTATDVLDVATGQSIPQSDIKKESPVTFPQGEVIMEAFPGAYKLKDCLDKATVRVSKLHNPNADAVIAEVRKCFKKEESPVTFPQGEVVMEAFPGAYKLKGCLDKATGKADIQKCFKK